MFHEKPSTQGQAHTTSLQHLICPIQLQNKTVFIQETPLSSTSQGTSQPWEPSPTGRSSAEVVQSLLGWSDKLGLFSAHQESSFTFKLIPALSGLNYTGTFSEISSISPKPLGLGAVNGMHCILVDCIYRNLKVNF